MDNYPPVHLKANFDNWATKIGRISYKTFYIKSYVALFCGFIYNILPKAVDVFEP